MTDKACDLTEVRSLAMRKTQAKMARLKAAGIPVTTEVFAELMKASNAEAKAECGAVSSELTDEQFAILKEICEPCAARFTVKKKAE